MPKLRFTRHLAFVLAAVVTLILAAWVFFFEETEFSLAKLSWHRRFNQAIEQNNEIKLADLVNFQMGEGTFFWSPMIL